MKIALMRPVDRNQSAYDFCSMHGLEPVIAPALEISRSDADTPLLLQAIGTSETCIFMSATAVDRFFEFQEAARLLLGRPDVQIVAVGEGTSRALQEHSIEAILPAKHSSEGLVHLFSSGMLKGRKAVVLRSDRGSTLLKDGLGKLGVSVSEFAVYGIGMPGDVSALRGVLAAILSGERFILPFSSSMMVRNFFGIASEMADSTEIASALARCEFWAIGDETAGTLGLFGITSLTVAGKADFDAMLDQIAGRHSA